MNDPLLTHPAVCCQTHGIRLAVAERLVQRVTSKICSPPPSWAQPWIGGLCWMDEDLLVVVDLSGAMSSQAGQSPRRPLLVVLEAIGHLPRWALAVEAAQEHVPVERHLVPYARPPAWPCPQEWLQSASDSAGRPLAWLDVARVAHRLVNGYQSLAVN
jgi:hypothetical protein